MLPVIKKSYLVNDDCYVRYFLVVEFILTRVVWPMCRMVKNVTKGIPQTRNTAHTICRVKNTIITVSNEIANEINTKNNQQTENETSDGEQEDTEAIFVE